MNDTKQPSKMEPPTAVDSPMPFACGKSMKNRFMLAPMTNLQSHDDGTLSDEEFRWLTMRAEGQFGLVMTCAANVQANGRCWLGQLGIYADRHIAGHRRLARRIQEHGSLAVVQLHHGGMRSPQEVIGERPVAPSDNEENRARGLSLPEVEQLRYDFIAAALRAQAAGYDGVEVHGAHGYLLTQFLSSEINHRDDRYGGSLENRSRLVFEIVRGIRQACGPAFLLGVRLSPERFGMQLPEVRQLSQWLIDSGQLDFLDLSLWDVFKTVGEARRGLLSHFTDLECKDVRLTVAGKIKNGEDVNRVLAAGIDFVTIGRSAILHHDFPARVMADPDFRPVSTPVSPYHLREEGLGEAFITYMRSWSGFVADEDPA